jgi:UDP-N-acetylmuramate: L-alanyl-gamma-D-glutamyl-meso-diaminopimelate ligase
VDGLPPGSLLIACDEDPHIPEAIAGAALTVRRYGRREGSHWRLGSITVDPPWTTFDVLQAGSRFARFRTRLIGTHNLLNALAGVAVADHLGLSAAALANALETFEGIRRRQEIRGEKRGIVVMDDFAHHPTAVRETIAAVKAAFPGRRIIAVFEPRTNSSMRKVFQPVYPDAFECADMICIRRPPRLDKVPEAERFSSEDLVAELNRRGKAADFFLDTDQIIDHLVQTAVSGDVILVMSNGGFDNIHERLLASL